MQTDESLANREAPPSGKPTGRLAIFGRIALSLAHISLGCLLGLLAVELTLRLVPGLLLRGMELPAPVDAPLTRASYTVRYSDADAFYWNPELIRPVEPENNRVEAVVTYETDEFGFRNPAPLPETIDAVVLGRSISLGAHLAEAWPQMLAERTGWKIPNLSQPGATMPARLAYLKKYAAPRHPKWVIIEIAPSIDLTGLKGPSTGGYTQALAVPLIQTLARKGGWTDPGAVRADPLYPLNIRLPGREYGLTCCLHYMEFYTADLATLGKSAEWRLLRSQLAALRQAAAENGACLAILLAPTKPDLYLPVMQDPSQFEPVARRVHPLQLAADSSLRAADDLPAPLEAFFANAYSGRSLLADYAAAQNIPFIDPTDRMTQAIREGQDPVMVYDSHWNAFGHTLVAEAAAQVLQDAACP